VNPTATTTATSIILSWSLSPIIVQKRSVISTYYTVSWSPLATGGHSTYVYNGTATNTTVNNLTPQTTYYITIGYYKNGLLFVNSSPLQVTTLGSSQVVVPPSSPASPYDDRFIAGLVIGLFFGILLLILAIICGRKKWKSKSKTVVEMENVVKPAPEMNLQLANPSLLSEPEPSSQFVRSLSDMPGATAPPEEMGDSLQQSSPLNQVNI